MTNPRNTSLWSVLTAKLTSNFLIPLAIAGVVGAAFVAWDRSDRTDMNEYRQLHDGSTVIAIDGDRFTFGVDGKTLAKGSVSNSKNLITFSVQESNDPRLAIGHLVTCNLNATGARFTCTPFDPMVSLSGVWPGTMYGKKE